MVKKLTTKDTKDTKEHEAEPGMEFAESSPRVIGYASGTTPAVLTINNSASIRGHLEIRDVASESGSFTNRGTVEANASGTLKLAVGGTVDDDDDDDRWKVTTNNGAILRFDSSIGALAAMAGEFVVSNGTLYIDKGLVTTGRLDLSGGLVDVRKNTTMGDQDLNHFLSMTGGQIKVIGVNPAIQFKHY